MNSDYNVSEKDAAARLGLDVRDVREMRGEIGGRWIRDSRRRIWWSEDGIKDAAREMSGADSGADVGGVPDPVDVIEMEVARTGFVNRRIMHCVVPGEEYDPMEPKVVQVRDAHLFVKGMRILARPVPGRGFMHEYIGNPAKPHAVRALPRAVGRW